MDQLRSLTRRLRGRATSDGAGVRLTRIIGTPELDHVDPFLLLDHFHSDAPGDYLAGFPDHPHRGFETVTYMLAGAMEHRDHKGNQGRLEAGGAQWMTAGRGIIHSEMPLQEDGLLAGFQLWVNLPAAAKMGEPRYQDIAPADIPEVLRHDGVRVRVIAGEAQGLRGAVTGIVTRPVYLDVTLPRGSRYREAIPRGHSAFLYVFEGEASVWSGEAAPAGEGERLASGTLGLLGDGDAVELRTAADGARLLLIAARPLGEPVARAGPVVMNTRAELEQAFRDLDQGTFLG